MKKFAIMALTAVMALTLFSGCGSKGVAANRVFSKADLDSIQGVKIGVQIGTTGDDCAKEITTSDVSEYSKGAEAILALKQAKVDCVIIDGEPAKAFVAKNNDLKILSDTFITENYAIAVAKENSALTEAINGALATLEANGTRASIIANYIGDNKGQTPYKSPENVDRSKGTLVMATNAYFEPYEYYAGEKIVGIDADMAQAICDILGYNLKIEDMDFESIITAVQTGKADFGMAGMTVTEDRLQNIDFTNTYAEASQVIIVRAK